MSQQQKMIFAVCLAAGLVALVAGQGTFDPLQCAQTARKTIEQYSQTMTQLMREMTTEMSQQGNSAFPVAQFTQDANEMISQFQQLTDMSQGFDAGRTLSIYNSIVRSQLAMSRYFLNPTVGMTFFRTYISYANKMVERNTEFVMSLSSQCMPQSRIALVGPN